MNEGEDNNASDSFKENLEEEDMVTTTNNDGDIKLPIINIKKVITTDREHSNRNGNLTGKSFKAPHGFLSPRGGLTRTNAPL